MNQNRKKITTSIRVLITAGIAVAVYGCTSLDYYTQTVRGQTTILQNRQPINALLVPGETDPELQEQLHYALRVREFAVNSLGLPDNDSYRYYVDLGRDYVVWNVFATPTLSLDNIQWCFMAVGCLNYRGYFSLDDARRLAARLDQEGHDVFIGGVRAYSTLGWFDDPLLNTMLRDGHASLAEVIFHELAHQEFFIKNDTEFNEAFAETVAHAGVRRWLRHGDAEERRRYEVHKRQESEFVSLVLRYRDRLAEVYESNRNDADKLREKRKLIRALGEEYRDLHSGWGDDTRFEAGFAEGLNNAKISAIVTYRRFLPGFETILESVNGDLPAFYARVRTLARCDANERERILLQQTADFDCRG